MRLIDADELLKYMETTEISQYIDEINKGNDNYSSTALYGYIKEMPAAYDMDKVVEHLNKDYENTDNDELLTSAEKEAVLCRITRDIDIIKAGGVNENKTEKPDYQNSAGILRSRQRGKETL